MKRPIFSLRWIVRFILVFKFCYFAKNGDDNTIFFWGHGKDEMRLVATLPPYKGAEISVPLLCVIPSAQHVSTHFTLAK